MGLEQIEWEELMEAVVETAVDREGTVDVGDGAEAARAPPLLASYRHGGGPGGGQVPPARGPWASVSASAPVPAIGAACVKS